MNTPRPIATMAAIKELCANPSRDHFALVMGDLIPILANAGISGDVLEIGVSAGHTHRHLARAVRDTNKTTGGDIRLWGLEKADPTDRFMVDLNALVDQLYAEGCPPHLVIADSRNCAALAEALRLSLLFVDGAHDYGTALSDLRTFAPSVVPGGVIVAHDANDEEGPRGTVWRAIQTFLERGIVEDQLLYTPVGHKEGVWFGIRTVSRGNGTTTG